MGRLSLCLLPPLVGLFGHVAAQQYCQSCYHLDIGTAVAIIVGDIILTLFIALSVFCLVSRMKKSQLEALEGKGNVAVRRNKQDDLEATYQELQGTRSDVYSDLRQPQK
ncbi:TYRO protein tyrosine kinase-binding protein [Amia ocellicauda]|uniref:TYRO protein tyrosine kinase-binding protein n=1 Tax=Amia ocellicauda TaxID=2972642 RepID=UPI0034642EA4